MNIEKLIFLLLSNRHCYVNTCDSSGIQMNSIKLRNLSHNIQIQCPDSSISLSLYLSLADSKNKQKHRFASPVDDGSGNCHNNNKHTKSQTRLILSFVESKSKRESVLLNRQCALKEPLEMEAELLRLAIARRDM